MGKESLYGIMAKSFKDNGNQVQKMALEYGNLQKEILIQDNG